MMVIEMYDQLPMRSGDHQVYYTTSLPWNDQVTHVVREFGWRARKWPQEPRGAEVAATLPAGEMCPQSGEINQEPCMVFFSHCREAIVLFHAPCRH